MLSEDGVTRTDRSPSPRPRAHRRTASTQSAVVDGAADSSGRKRRAVTQFPVRDPKSAKAGWEESDASSETTSHGHPESRRPQRGVGRSTSTPGRPVPREHKRHVNKYGFTRLAEACEAGDLDLVKEWREKDPDQLELAEFAGNKPLQIAALNGNAEVVSYLIDQGCQIDCANVDKDTPLIDAAENGHLEVVRLLLSAGVDPLRQNLKGQQALDVVTDDTDDADGIRAALRGAIESWNSEDAKQRREEEEEQRHRAGPTKELHFMARTYENLLRLVTINDRNGVREFLDARVPVDNAVIATAAKTGDLYLVNMLLAEMTEKKAYQKAEKPMLSVLGTSHWEMVKALTELDQFNPLYRSRAGKTWPELAEDRNGSNWRQERELLQRLYDQRSSLSMARLSSSPVTKREHGHGKRRFAQQDDDDESDQEDAPKQRKNGRRLMSRRDMRAASGKAPSDSDSDDTGSDTPLPPDAHDDASMRPPGSPPQKRLLGRPRADSTPSQPDHAFHGGRRRSSSFRGITEHVLPTVEEKPEDRVEDQVSEEKTLEERNRVEEAKFAIEQAQRLEARQKEAAQAEAEAKRVEEAARKAEEERKAEEARIKLEEEEARLAEEAKQREEERRRHEAQMEDARRKHRDEVYDALPPALYRALNLDAEFDFEYDGVADLSYLVEHFNPLLVVKRGRVDVDGIQEQLTTEKHDMWVLNAQVAALLGKRGIELLLHRTSLGFERTFSEGWPTFEDFSAHERRLIEQVVLELAAETDSDEDAEAEIVDDLPFADELKLAAERCNARARAKKRLLDGTAALYCVRLADVLQHLDPLLQGTPIYVRSLTSSSRAPLQNDSAELAPAKERWSEGFLSRLSEAWDRSLLPRTYTAGQLVGSAAPALGMSDVVLVHEK